jgi:hypothetical protein
LDDVIGCDVDAVECDVIAFAEELWAGLIQTVNHFGGHPLE